MLQEWAHAQLLPPEWLQRACSDWVAVVEALVVEALLLRGPWPLQCTSYQALCLEPWP